MTTEVHKLFYWCGSWLFFKFRPFCTILFSFRSKWAWNSSYCLAKISSVAQSTIFCLKWLWERWRGENFEMLICGSNSILVCDIKNWASAAARVSRYVIGQYIRAGPEVSVIDFERQNWINPLAEQIPVLSVVRLKISPTSTNLILVYLRVSALETYSNNSQSRIAGKSMNVVLLHFKEIWKQSQIFWATVSDPSWKSRFDLV